MAGTRVVLDTCAVIQLRKSSYNEFIDKSLFELAGGEQNLKEQQVGDKLRGWLERAMEKPGWTVCITKAAIMESEGEFKQMIDRVAGHVHGRPATVKFMLDNRRHTNSLYKRSSDCSRVLKGRIIDIKGAVRSAYRKWENDTTRNCVTNYGVRNKAYFPEKQDIRRLAESVANKNGSSRRVIFLSSDGHFLCHVSTIDKEFGVEVMDFRNL